MVMYNSWDQNGVFKMHTKNGVVEFKPSERGLHYVDVYAEGDVLQHMLVTANMSKEEDDKEIESANKECMMHGHHSLGKSQRLYKAQDREGPRS
jgi:hypothetical protein